MSASMTALDPKLPFAGQETTFSVQRSPTMAFALRTHTDWYQAVAEADDLGRREGQVCGGQGAATVGSSRRI